MYKWFDQWLLNMGLDETLVPIVSRGFGLAGLIILAVISNYLAKRVILKVLYRLIDTTKSRWDDDLKKRKVFENLSHLAPAVVIYLLAPVTFEGYELLIKLAQNGAAIYMIVIGVLVINALLSAIVDIYQRTERSREIPIRGFVQLIKVIVLSLSVIMIASILLSKNPVNLLTGLGAMTAVLMLVFRDIILGFVSGIQLTSNRMLARGDWIEMPKYGADGDVLEVTLSTVKVRNWDNTVTTIPTYALISESFKNWRGMAESDGRRIKRAINIDMNTIRLCTKDEIEKLKEIHLITGYLEKKQADLAKYNEEHGIKENESVVNGRRITNIGTFRAYIIEYLRHHPMINQNLTLLVRQLNPTPQGIPIEVYVFSKDKNWINYEGIQADIFDHLLAVIPEFGLRVFQEPSGHDLGRLVPGSA